MLCHIIFVSSIQFESHVFVLAVSQESALLFCQCFVFLYCHISACYLQTLYGLNPISSRLAKRRLVYSHRLFLVSILSQFVSSVVEVSPSHLGMGCHLILALYCVPGQSDFLVSQENEMPLHSET